MFGVLKGVPSLQILWKSPLYVSPFSQHNIIINLVAMEKWQRMAAEPPLRKVAGEEAAGPRWVTSARAK